VVFSWLTKELASAQEKKSESLSLANIFAKIIIFRDRSTLEA
jgi:hypothetical protein